MLTMEKRSPSTLPQFAEEVANVLGGEVKTVERANGVCYTGISFASPGITVAPVIYIDDMFKRGLSVTDAVREVASAGIDSVVSKDFSRLRDIADWNVVKEKLCLRLYNKETKAEVFRSAAECGYDDLIIVPYMEDVINNGTSTGSVKVSKALLGIWDVSEEEVFAVAEKNACNRFVVKMLKDKLEEAGFYGELPGDNPMADVIVVTRNDNMFGAFGAIVLRSVLKAMCPKGYWILPSSVHEVLVMPDRGDFSKDELDELVRSVNSSAVLPEEVLGDKAYYFAP